MIIVRLKILIWVLLDFLTRKNLSYWVFPTHYIQTSKLKDNARAVFEKVKNNKDIKKIIVYRGDSFDNNLDSFENTVIVRHGTLAFFYYLSRAKVIFLANSISMDFSFRFPERKYALLKINQKKRIVVNLWHGIPLKGVFYTSPESHYKKIQKNSYRVNERVDYKGLVSSSKIDSYVMASSFYPLNYSQVWITGLPRNDFLLMDFNDLPDYMRKSFDFIESIKNGKRLIIYAPTHRQKPGNSSESYEYYQFSESEIIRLKSFLIKNNMILGYRPHYFKSEVSNLDMSYYIDNEYIFDFSLKYFDDFSMIARQMDMLITDYSSVFMDALFLNKPALSFAYDIESYKAEQDGLLYDLNSIFADYIFYNFEELLDCLDGIIVSNDHQSKMQDVFYSYIDSDNSQRVINKINESVY